jgi:hypothetical protein
MKAKGLDALASAAAGSPQVPSINTDMAATSLHQDAPSESTVATADANVTLAAPTQGMTQLANLTPQQQQQILQLLKNHQSNNATTSSHVAPPAPSQVSPNVNTAQAAALLSSLQQLSQNQNPLLALQGQLQQQLASQQLLQLLLNRQQQQQQSTGAGSNPPTTTSQTAPNNTSSYLDVQAGQKLQALFSGLAPQSHSSMGTCLITCRVLGSPWSSWRPVSLDSHSTTLKLHLATSVTVMRTAGDRARVPLGQLEFS